MISFIQTLGVQRHPTQSGRRSHDSTDELMYEPFSFLELKDTTPMFQKSDVGETESCSRCSFDCIAMRSMSAHN